MLVLRADNGMVSSTPLKVIVITAFYGLARGWRLPTKSPVRFANLQQADAALCADALRCWLNGLSNR
jgi:hypothetical protein